MKNQNELAAIIGAKGKTGRRVVERLKGRGLAVRELSRSTQLPFDWNDSSTWATALAGVSSVYVTYSPDLAAPGAAAHVEQLCHFLKGTEVRRIVLLAGRGEPQVHPAERAVRESGLDWVILECAFFNQNFNEGVLAPVDDTIYFPAGKTAEPFLDCDDIADSVVEALTNDAHLGRTYELTGPRLLTFEEVAAEISRASGRTIRFQDVSFEQYAEMLTPHMPPPVVKFFVELFRYLMDGHNAHVTDGVQQLLGRPAKDFREYAKEATTQIASLAS